MTDTAPAALKAAVLFRAEGTGLPDFAAIEAAQYEAAIDAAMAEHREEIRAIAGDPEAPSFDNTVAAMERSGKFLSRAARMFFTLTGAYTNDPLQAAERALAPKLSRHSSAITLDPALFARIDALHAQRDVLGLGAEELRLLERVWTSFTRGGARLKGADRARLEEIDARLSALGTQFSQNILADERSFVLPLGEEDLAGLPDFLRSAMAEAATERGLAGYALTLSRSLVVPFLTFSERSDLREQAYAAWVARGENPGPTDNRPVMAEILKLRAEKAKLLGYPSFAAFKLEDTMAKSPQQVRRLLEEVWSKAKERAAADALRLAELAAASGENAPLRQSDWRFYAQKLRKAEFDVDETVVKPYFQLERMIEAAFDVAGRLFGLRFEPLPEARAWHPDVRVWRVRDKNGQERGLFLGDYFARSSKRSGAWMSALRSQHRLDGGELPIIYNIMNFAKPAAGDPALLSLDDARTLFHEFGHGLHGLLSDVTWPSLAGTAVARDFVELPSQLFEHWLSVPEVLARHAIHAVTGEPMPVELMERLLAARSFDAGFDAVEYTASALVDLALHESAEPPADPLSLEAATLSSIGMPREIGMRHRSPHFAHIFSGDGYSAGYYSYMWSEVLDADAFDAFMEAGDAFHPETAERLLRHVYAAGNSRDADELYLAFRGRMPSTQALLKKRGLAA